MPNIAEIQFTAKPGKTRMYRIALAYNRELY
jgi:hypothetical protein